MSYYNEKPKNDFEKPKFTPIDHEYPDRERGGCLTLFLVFVIAINVFALFSLCSQASQLTRSSYGSGSLPLVGFAFAIQCVVIACAVATWNWQKWGYYGMLAGYALQIFFSLCSGSLLMIGASIFWLIVFLAVTNNKVELFD